METKDVMRREIKEVEGCNYNHGNGQIKEIRERMKRKEWKESSW